MIYRIIYSLELTHTPIHTYILFTLVYSYKIHTDTQTYELKIFFIDKINLFSSWKGKRFLMVYQSIDSRYNSGQKSKNKQGMMLRHQFLKKIFSMHLRILQILAHQCCFIGSIVKWSHHRHTYMIHQYNPSVRITT